MMFEPSTARDPAFRPTHVPVLRRRAAAAERAERRLLYRLQLLRERLERPDIVQRAPAGLRVERKAKATRPDEVVLQERRRNPATGAFEWRLVPWSLIARMDMRNLFRLYRDVLPDLACVLKAARGHVARKAARRAARARARECRAGAAS